MVITKSRQNKRCCSRQGRYDYRYALVLLLVNTNRLTATSSCSVQTAATGRTGVPLQSAHLQSNLKFDIPKPPPPRKPPRKDSSSAVEAAAEASLTKKHDIATERQDHNRIPPPPPPPRSIQKTPLDHKQLKESNPPVPPRLDSHCNNKIENNPEKPPPPPPPHPRLAQYAKEERYHDVSALQEAKPPPPPPLSTSKSKTLEHNLRQDIAKENPPTTILIGGSAVQHHDTPKLDEPFGAPVNTIPQELPSLRDPGSNDQAVAEMANVNDETLLPKTQTESSLSKPKVTNMKPPPPPPPKPIHSTDKMMNAQNQPQQQQRPAPPRSLEELRKLVRGEDRADGDSHAVGVQSIATVTSTNMSPTRDDEERNQQNELRQDDADKIMGALPRKAVPVTQTVVSTEEAIDSDACTKNSNNEMSTTIDGDTREVHNSVEERGIPIKDNVEVERGDFDAVVVKESAPPPPPPFTTTTRSSNSKDSFAKREMKTKNDIYFKHLKATLPPPAPRRTPPPPPQTQSKQASVETSPTTQTDPKMRSTFPQERATDPTPVQKTLPVEQHQGPRTDSKQPPMRVEQTAPHQYCSDYASSSSQEQIMHSTRAAAPASTRSKPPPKHKSPPPNQYYSHLYPSSQYPPPNRQYHGRRAAPTASLSIIGPPVLQSLWSRVEKGLDGLANIEDAITGRAQQLVSTAIPKPWGQTKSSPPQQQQRKQQQQKLSGPQPQRRPTASSRTPPKKTHTSQPLSTPQTRWQQQNKRLSENNRREESKTSAQPSVSIHPYAASSSLVDNALKQSESTPGSTTSVRKVEWNGLLAGRAGKLMPANGGASSPNDHQSWTYPGQQRFSSSAGEDAGPGADSDGKVPGGDNINQRQSLPDEPQRVSDSQKPEVVSSQRGPGQPFDQMRTQQYPGGMTAPQGPTRGEGNWQSPGSRGGLPAASSGSPRVSIPGQASSGPRQPPVQPSRPLSYPDEDDDGGSRVSRILKALPIPSFGKIFRFRRSEIYNNFASLDAWDAQDDGRSRSGGFFSFFRRQSNSDIFPPATATVKKMARNDGPLPEPVQRMMDRSSKGQTVSLLSPSDERRIRGLGKSRAILDATALFLIVAGIRQLSGLENVPIPTTFHELWSLTVPGLLTVCVSSLDTWAPIALAAAILTVWTNSLLFDGRIESIAVDVARSVANEASYGKLFLRLVASTPTNHNLPESISQAARLQATALAELCRLRSYITYAIAAIVGATVAFIRPFLVSVAYSILKIGTLPQWRTWPIPLGHLLEGIKAIFGVAGNELSSLISGELKGAGHHPMQVAFKASILASLVAVACLPDLEKRRKIAPKDDGDEEDTEDVSRRMAEQISDLGSSSAGRLGLLSKSGWVESTIERWRLVQDESSNLAGDVSIVPLMRRVGYYIASWCILAAPLLIFGFLLDVPVSGWTSAVKPRWESMLEVSLLLLFTNGLVWKTIEKVVEASDINPDIIGFLKSLAQASEEIVQHRVLPRPLSGSFNPTAGLAVKDFWAAHIFKRAWAVRGAHLACRNGEVLVLLGDDGAGKSRLLTALAESIVSPPKQALTATKVRGSVSVGGIDVTQWDRNELKKRVGLFLNDIRTLANRAEMWSGMSLEDVLEPGDGLHKVADPTHTSGATEKACMIAALKITGLYYSLLPRLPSKLSTYLSSNEEDLRPSPLRPRYNVLSPTEWSKLMLAKLIAQALYDNENSSVASERIENSLVGSIFLLDDATTLLSELDETKLLRDLRRTGAATVLSSNKWATGRLADRIAVVKDGTIVETGTHNELLSRGPQNSLYAAKWHAMTSG